MFKESKKISWFISGTTSGGAILNQTETIERINAIMAANEIKAFNLDIIQGVWEGKSESTYLVFLIDIAGMGESKYYHMGREFSIEFNQDCVLTTIEPVKYCFC